MSEKANKAFNNAIASKLGKKPAKPDPDELVERAGAAIEELQTTFAELAELAGATLEEEPEEEEEEE